MHIKENPTMEIIISSKAGFPFKYRAKLPADIVIKSVIDNPNNCLKKAIYSFSFCSFILIYINILTGSSNKPFKVCRNAEPTAPSTTLWSHESVTFITLPGTN